MCYYKPTDKKTEMDMKRDENAERLFVSLLLRELPVP